MISPVNYVILQFLEAVESKTVIWIIFQKHFQFYAVFCLPIINSSQHLTSYLLLRAFAAIVLSLYTFEDWAQVLSTGFFKVTAWRSRIINVGQESTSQLPEKKKIVLYNWSYHMFMLNTWFIFELSNTPGNCFQRFQRHLRQLKRKRWYCI